MSDDLIAFLKAWHDWATNGAPEGEPFTRRYGLCKNSFAARLSCDAFEEMSRALGPSAFPFGYLNYQAAKEAKTQHECPKRLAWVRAKLVEAGELVA